MPYWRTASSTADALTHINAFKEINPFGYSVKTDGTLADTAGLEIVGGKWDELLAAARTKKIRVVPTLMWSDGNAIHRILSNGVTRRKLEDAIANLVKDKGYDGIDIDFEGKKAETKDYFSTFLKGLYQRMGTKWVMCDIEPRTPVDSRYDSTPPKDATDYANDYVQINKYCDRVRIMAYDQGAIDVKLNKTALQAPYVPVADPQWVYKVVNLVLKNISKKKLVLGVATYGYEYSVTPFTGYGYSYDLQWAFNPKYATDLAAQYGATISRNRAGERSFVYIPNLFPNLPAQAGSPPPGTTPTSLSNNDTVPVTATTGSGQAGPVFNILWWSDASAINDKIAIAKELGLRGIAIFKIDGGEDLGLWDLLPH